MDKAGQILSLVLGIFSLLSIGAGIGMYYTKSSITISLANLDKTITDKIAAQTLAFQAHITTQVSGFQTLKDDILFRIDHKLDDYLRKQEFKDYKESHALEHLRLEQELTRLRDSRHETAPLLREIQSNIKDFHEWKSTVVAELNGIRQNTGKIEDLDSRIDKMEGNK